jgi:type 2A phosphatase activator TIP41
MDDCFLGLLRYYLRVDHVLVRIIDTRLFHSFDSNYILREFNVKENSYDELINKGFKFTSDFSLSHVQGDMVSKYLDTIYEAKDKIIFN